MALQFSRDVDVYVKTTSTLNSGSATVWKLGVLDGFSFSQAINASEITVNEAGITSRRARLLFNDSLAPVEWSFSTYARPTLSTNHVAPEQALWAMMLGADSYSSSTFKNAQGVTVATSDSTDLDFGLVGSNVSSLSDAWELYFSFKPTGGNAQVYKITQAVVNNVTMDFDIDGIATLQWSGFGATLVDEGSTETGYAAAITTGLDKSTNFIRNRISTVDLVRTDKLIGSPQLESAGGEIFALPDTDYTFNDNTSPALDTLTTSADQTGNISQGDIVTGTGIAPGTTVTSIDATTITLSLQNTAPITGTLQFYTPNRDVYNIVLTGGSINIENNVSYLTPEELGIVNSPLANITGSRSISGNLTCYLDNDISSSKSGELFSDLVSDTSTVRNTFDMGINVGGTAAAGPHIKFDLPTAHLEIPVINVEDLLTLDIAFHGQVSGGDVNLTNEMTVIYTGINIA
jgi:hypothetical protein